MSNLIERFPPELMQDCYKNLAAFGKAFFPHRFFRNFSPLHKQIFDTLMDKSSQKKLILAPRGTGKTTIDTILFPAYCILFELKQFIVLVSNSSTSAILQSENLKRELLSNQHIIRNFAPIKSKNFSKDMWVTSNGTMVLPRGAKQQIRGILHGHHRPDLIVVDDLEDSEMVRSEDQRKYMKEWFLADLLNSVDRGSKNWEVIIIGTLLHEDSLLANIKDWSDWKVVELSICDDDYKSNWPEFMSDAYILTLVDQFRSSGNLDVFYREYMNRPISSEDAPFQQSFFKYYEEKDLVNLRNTHMTNVLLVDPAKSVKPNSDYSAIEVWGLHESGLFLRDLIRERLHPDQLYQKVADLATIYGVSSIGVEVNSLNEFIVYPLKSFLFNRGLSYHFIELKPRMKKEDRIKQLSSLYRRGIIYHRKEISNILEEELLSFPRSKYDDASDCAAYILQMLEQNGYYPTASGLIYQTEEILQTKYNEADAIYAQIAKQYDSAIPDDDWCLI